jgi:hypothetical protein
VPWQRITDTTCSAATLSFSGAPQQTFGKSMWCLLSVWRLRLLWLLRPSGPDARAGRRLLPSAPHRVARDLSGAKFWWNHPFVHDPTTTAAAQKGALSEGVSCCDALCVSGPGPSEADLKTHAAAHTGLPFKASCCWNGLAVLRATPFAAGLRIRQPMQGECQVRVVWQACFVVPRHN